MARTRFTLACVSTLVVGLGGCYQPDAEVQQLRQDRLQLTEQVASLSADLDAARARNQALAEQLARSAGVDPDDFSRLFVVDRIRIASLSGPADLDGRPGHDGVRVHVQPLDRDGDVLKAAGEVTIEIFDLTASEGPRSIGRRVFPAEEVGRHWLGRMMTNHFSFEVPWSAPLTGEGTIRVEFVDQLTRRVHSAQQPITAAR